MLTQHLPAIKKTPLLGMGTHPSRKKELHTWHLSVVEPRLVIMYRHLKRRFGDRTSQEVEAIKFFGHLQYVWSYQDRTRYNTTAVCCLNYWSRVYFGVTFGDYI